MAKLLTMVLKAVDLCFNCGGLLYNNLYRGGDRKLIQIICLFKGSEVKHICLKQWW